MHAKAARGEIDKSVVKEFDDATDFSSLPERAPKLVKTATGRKVPKGRG